MIDSSHVKGMSVTERLQAVDQLWDSPIAAVMRHLPQTGIKTFWLKESASPARRSKVSGPGFGSAPERIWATMGFVLAEAQFLWI